MGQWLRTFAALQKDLGWVPNTHDRQLTITCNSTSRDSTPSVLCTYLHSHVHISQTCTHTHTNRHTYICDLKTNLLKRILSTLKLYTTFNFSLTPDMYKYIFVQNLLSYYIIDYRNICVIYN